MPSCGSCGESRFTNGGQLSCHRAMNHATYDCGCGRRFMTEPSRQQHLSSRAQASKAVKCDDCCKSFVDDASLYQHKFAKNHSPPKDPMTDCDCGKRYKSNEDLKKHMTASEVSRPCLICSKKFKTPESLNQHKNDSGHTYKPSNDVHDNQRKYLANYLKNNVVLDKCEKKKAVEKTTNTLNKIMQHVRGQDGGEIYGNEIRKAGSYSMETKVGKPDEFDYNVPMSIPRDISIPTKGKVPFKYEPRDKGGPSASNLNVVRKLHPIKRGYDIPRGYAAVKIDDEQREKFKDVECNGYLVPRKVQEDLYKKIGTALKDLNIEGVDLSRNAHGPAITLTIKDPTVGHHISVDVAPTIDQCPIPISENGWPRPATKETFSQEKIDKVLAAGTHLVPKGAENWYISSSKAEKALLDNCDEGNECRKTCHKLMKRDFEKMKSESVHGYPGISTHIFKNTLFWMMEDKNYSWKENKLNESYMNYLRRTKRFVDQKKLPNPFNTSENLLKGKDPEVLRDLSHNLQKRISELAHIVQ